MVRSEKVMLKEMEMRKAMISGSAGGSQRMTKYKVRLLFVVYALTI